MYNVDDWTCPESYKYDDYPEDFDFEAEQLEIEIGKAELAYERKLDYDNGVYDNEV